MANTKNTKANKIAKAKKNNKKRENVFKRIGHFFKEVVSELRKVTWPTRKTLIAYTIAVIIFVVIMMILVYFLDLGATSMFDFLIPD